MTSDEPAHRCGSVALLGRPNAGKSTLLNTVLGEQLAITTPHAQTTRGRILGVLTRPDAQIMFQDTPGVNRGRARFNLEMTEVAMRTAELADLCVLLLDARAHWDAPEERILERAQPCLLVRTKVDLAAPTPVRDPDRFVEVLELSARSSVGVDHFLERVIRRLPVSPPLYPEDYLTDVSLRFLAAERVREVAFELYQAEIPYALAVEVESWDESDTELRIRANVLVERESQKAIVLGKGGCRIRDLGQEARGRIGRMLQKRVHLNLWVKLDRNWSRRPRRARQLGYL